jgi:hypothetical protein
MSYGAPWAVSLHAFEHDAGTARGGGAAMDGAQERADAVVTRSQTDTGVKRWNRRGTEHRAMDGWALEADANGKSNVFGS